MNFKELMDETELQIDLDDSIDEDVIRNPFASKKKDGKYEEGMVFVDFLNKNYGIYDNAQDMKNNSRSEGLKRLFDWLVDEGYIPKD